MIAANMETILPHIGPIRPWLEDDDVSEIMRNGDGSVYVERHGKLELLPGVALDEPSLLLAVENIVRILGAGDFNIDHPLVDARIADGSRVAAAHPCVSMGGTCLNIRKFNSKRYTMEELVRIGSVSAEQAAVIGEAISEERTILFSGGTSTGKTTLLNALTSRLDPAQRVVLIEDTQEIQLHQPHVVRMVTKRDEPAVTIRDLVKHANRQRPDRIIVGEVRGAEAFDLLNALNSGHGGSLVTIHADNVAGAMTKLEMYVMQAGENMPLPAVRQIIAQTVKVVVQLKRDRETGRRYVSEIVSVGWNSGQYELKNLEQRGGEQ